MRLGRRLHRFTDDAPNVRSAIRRPVVRCVAVALVAAVAAAMPAHATTAEVRQSPSAWPPLASAVPFFLDELRDKTVGHWEAAWRTLHPLHQQVASRTDFVRCERLRPFPAPIEALHVIGVRRSPVRVPGLARPVAGVAVEVRVELRWYGPRDPIVLRHTFHLVPVHGHWTWLLSPSRYRLYLNHDCAPGLAV
jgi:hypothetical protein